MSGSKKMTVVDGWDDFESKVLRDASEVKKLAMRVGFFAGAQVAMMCVRQIASEDDPVAYIERLEAEIFSEAAAMVAQGTSGMSVH